jgi:hypothetical protein
MRTKRGLQSYEVRENRGVYESLDNDNDNESYSANSANPFLDRLV